MKLKLLLAFIQIMNIYNTELEIKYSKPFFYNNKLYILGNGQILNKDDEDVFQVFITEEAISHSLEIGTPLMKDPYIITINVNSDNENFYFIKINMETTSPSTSLPTSIPSNFKKQINSNICLFQMKIDDLTDYYYASWIGDDFRINLIEFNSDITGISSTIKSNIICKGTTIDCKAFTSFGNIVCVHVGYDGCNLNVYKKDFTGTYSDILIQKKNLIDLGFDCNINSKGQKYIKLMKINFLCVIVDL